METPTEFTSLPALDEYGLIQDPACWNETVAKGLARTLNIHELSDDHWLVIYALRDYFNKFGVAPAMGHVCRSYARDYHWVSELFGSCLNAWCIAGLPDPGEEAKSYLSDM